MTYLQLLIVAVLTLYGLTQFVLAQKETNSAAVAMAKLVIASASLALAAAVVLAELGVTP